MYMFQTYDDAYDHSRLDLTSMFGEHSSSIIK